MATTSIEGPAGSVPEGTPSGPSISREELHAQSQQLYEQCLKSPPDTIWVQRELANLQIAETTPILMKMMQYLVDTHHFKLLQMDGTVCWKIRTKTEVDK